MFRTKTISQPLHPLLSGQEPFGHYSILLIVCPIPKQFQSYIPLRASTWTNAFLTLETLSTQQLQQEQKQEPPKKSRIDWTNRLDNDTNFIPMTTNNPKQKK